MKKDRDIVEKPRRMLGSDMSWSGGELLWILNAWIVFEVA
jgi:hypothetical protein